MPKHTPQTSLKSVMKLLLNEIRNQSHRPRDFFKTNSAQVEPLLVKSMVSVLPPDYTATKFLFRKEEGSPSSAEEQTAAESHSAAQQGLEGQFLVFIRTRYYWITSHIRRGAPVAW